MAGTGYVSIVDSETAQSVAIKKSTGEMKVEASVPGTVNVSVQGTADVNVASTSDPLPTTPGIASSVDWGQKDVDATAGGTDIGGTGSVLGLHIANLDASITVYLGFDGTALNATNGFPLFPKTVFTLPPNVGISGIQVKGITASGTARIGWWIAS